MEDNPIFEAQTMAERRKNPRQSLRLPVQFQTGSNDQDVTLFNNSLTRNLGTGGMAMVTSQALETGSMVRLKIYLPKNTENISDALPRPETHQAVAVFGRVVWRQHLFADEYLLGIQFLDLNAEDGEQLKRFLKEFRLQEPLLDNS